MLKPWSRNIWFGMIETYTAELDFAEIWWLWWNLMTQWYYWNVDFAETWWICRFWWFHHTLFRENFVKQWYVDKKICYEKCRQHGCLCSRIGRLGAIAALGYMPQSLAVIKNFTISRYIYFVKLNILKHRTNSIAFLIRTFRSVPQSFESDRFRCAIYMWRHQPV